MSNDLRQCFLFSLIVFQTNLSLLYLPTSGPEDLPFLQPLSKAQFASHILCILIQTPVSNINMRSHGERKSWLVLRKSHSDRQGKSWSGWLKRMQNLGSYLCGAHETGSNSGLVLDSAVEERHENVGVMQRAMEMGKRWKYLTYEERLREISLLSLEQRMLGVFNIRVSIQSITEWGAMEDRPWLFPVMPTDRIRVTGHKLKYRKFYWRIRN